MSLRSFSSQLVVLAIVAAGVAASSSQAGCADALGLCKPTSRTAGVTILSAWCERYTQCDPKRGTVQECVDERLASSYVPTDDGCGASCSDDTSDCHRSTCNEERVDECKTKSFAMTCDEQLSNMLIHYPSFCDSCFNN